MKKPIISVVIPVYNREKYIKNCLDIMMNQSYKHLEIIVVDDGSSDSSVEIVKQYPTVKLIEHKENQGPSVARNSGIEVARGEYLHFMDTDDEINSTFYENMLKASEKTDADMACCGMIHQKSRGKTQIFKQMKVYSDLQDKLKITYVGQWGYSVRYLFRMEFIQKNNLRFEKGRIIEDLPFSFTAVYFANKIVTVPNAEYLYVYNPTSLLTSKKQEARKKRRADRKYSNQFVLDFAKKHGNFEIPAVTKGKLRYILRKLWVLLSNPPTTLKSK